MGGKSSEDSFLKNIINFKNEESVKYKAQWMGSKDWAS